MICCPTHISKELLLGNSRDREIIQKMSRGDSSLRTGLVRLAFVTGENALERQNALYNFSYSRLG